MRRVMFGVAAIAIAIGGPPAALFIAGQDRPEYARLHPGPPGFDHVFGALLFPALALVPLAAAAFLAWRYTFMAPGNTK